LRRLDDKLHPNRQFQRSVSNRKCIVTGENKERKELIRFVLDPLGRVVPDLAQKLPGKGMWVKACYKTISTSVERKIFEKSSRRKVLIPEAFLKQIENTLVERAMSGVGLARRAGRIFGGYAKIDIALRKRKVLIRIEAKDGGLDGRKKLDHINPNILVLDSAYGAELAKVFNGHNIVHLAVSVNNAPGNDGLVSRLKKDFNRLECFRSTSQHAKLEKVDLQVY
jgi:uncharacterized protein